MEQILSDFELRKARYILNPSFLRTDLLKFEVKPFHEEWIEAFENNSYLVLLAPRGHGKTSIVGAYIIWKIITNPDIRILIVTVNQQKADEMMNIIKGNLESNSKLIEYFGDQRGGIWSSSQIKIKKASWKHKEPTLQVLGLTSSQISSHYDLIILDDIVDDKNSATEHRRRALISWYNNALMPMLEPGGRVFDIGTKWHALDIHSYLSNLPIYKTLIYKAIIKEPDDEHPDIEPEVLWPERFPYYDIFKDNKLLIGLKTIRDKHIGRVAFAMQYQNEIIQTEDAPIKLEWIEQSKERWDELSIPPDIRRYIGVDLASKGTGMDYFSLTVIGKDKSNNIYVLDSVRANETMGKQLEIIKSYDAKWAPISIGIESNAAQKIITDEWISTTSLPIVQLKSSWVNDKWSRVERLAVLFETGRIILKPTLLNLIDELTEFPRGKHDDSIDSLSFAIQLSEKDTAPSWKEYADIITAKSVWNVSKV